ncbi:hypothetical protein ACJJTC_009649 [Scirpophaga incertulas]
MIRRFRRGVAVVPGLAGAGGGAGAGRAGRALAAAALAGRAGRLAQHRPAARRRAGLLHRLQVCPPPAAALAGRAGRLAQHRPAARRRAGLLHRLQGECAHLLLPRWLAALAAWLNTGPPHAAALACYTACRVSVPTSCCRAGLLHRLQGECAHLLLPRWLAALAAWLNTGPPHAAALACYTACRVSVPTSCCRAGLLHRLQGEVSAPTSCCRAGLLHRLQGECAHLLLPRWLAALAAWLNTGPPHAAALACYTACRVSVPTSCCRAGLLHRLQGECAHLLLPRWLAALAAWLNTGPPHAAALACYTACRVSVPTSCCRAGLLHRLQVRPPPAAALAGRAGRLAQHRPAARRRAGLLHRLQGECAHLLLPRWLAALAAWLNTGPPHAAALACYTACRVSVPTSCCRAGWPRWPPGSTPARRTPPRWPATPPAGVSAPTSCCRAGLLHRLQGECAHLLLPRWLAALAAWLNTGPPHAAALACYTACRVSVPTSCCRAGLLHRLQGECAHLLLPRWPATPPAGVSAPTSCCRAGLLHRLQGECAHLLLPRWPATPPAGVLTKVAFLLQKEFPEEILKEPVVRDAFRKALDMLNRSSDIEGVEAPPPPRFTITDTKETTRIADVLASTTQQKSFSELLESRCIEKGITFVPIAGKIREGRPIYKIGEMQCYVIRNVVMYSEDSGRTFNPISMDRLLSMVEE